MSQKLLWEPKEKTVSSSLLNLFCKNLEKKKFLKNERNFYSLWKWTAENPEIFWSEVWDFSKIIGDKGKVVLKKNETFNKNVFFPEGNLNYAENLLKKRDQDLAINFLSENGDEDEITWKSLYEKVCKFSFHLKSLGLKKGDRVAAYVPNKIETIICFLACAKNGLIWSSCSPDFGSQGVVDRFFQIKPSVLITCDYYFYNGKKINILEKKREILDKISSIKKVIVFSYNHKNIINQDNCMDFNKCLENSEIDETFEKFEFNHPIYIVYSSGTTGKPKCITHGAGNVLLEHNKELMLHCNIKAKDKMFYYTTTGWMMWNWLVGGLAVQASLFLYDGAPTYPKIDVLFDYCEKKNFKLFGVSAKYIDHLKNEKFKSNKFDLKSLEIIASTGSPLSEESFQYVYDHIKKDVHLASIAGGTDLVGCLVMGNLFSNVYKGEIQGQSLGIDVDVFNQEGSSTMAREKGELVVKKPFPTMPVKFWGDDGTKYHNAYFTKFKNIWHHGDYIEKTKNNGFTIYGRSDATLNPGGVRIGTSEIYQQVENIDFITEGLVVGQDYRDDVRIILFVTTKNNEELNEEKKKFIKARIKKNCSPKHIPAVIIKVPEIPRTKSGKIVELAVRKVINGEELNNKEAIANPKSLDFFKNLSQLLD